MSLDEDNDTNNPPSAKQVAQRALILCALTCRAHIDTDPRDKDAKSVYGQLSEWLKESNLLAVADHDEVALLSSLHGSLKKKTRIQASWHAEGLSVLCWALNKSSFPKHDVKSDPFELAETLGFLSNDPTELVESAQLRSDSEVEACRELQYDIHTRLRDFRRNGGTKDFSSWVEPERMSELGVAPASILAQKDLSIGGVPLSKAAEEAIVTCEDITYERHKASIWLIGEQGVYGKVTVDT